MLYPNLEVLVDGGGNHADWVRRYLPRLGKFHRIYVFEPNPTFHTSYGPDMILVKKAIWTEDCRMKFHVSKDERQVNSSLFEDKLSRTADGLIPYWQEEIEVECVDFGKWLRENIKPHYNLTLKLDIEGAEYEVLTKMIEDGSIRMVKKLFVEFHTDTLTSKAALKPALLTKLQSLVEVHEWD